MFIVYGLLFLGIVLRNTLLCLHFPVIIIIVFIEISGTYVPVAVSSTTFVGPGVLQPQIDTG